MPSAAPIASARRRGAGRGAGRRRAVEGRSAHQAPEVDGTTTVESGHELRPGQIVTATVTGSDGVDLTARATGPAHPSGPSRTAEDPVRLSTARSLADRR